MKRRAIARQSRFNRRHLAIAVGLATITLATYWQVRSCDFIFFDDNGYFFDSPHVMTGLSWKNLVWAFTTGAESNWHPLTWLSLQTDAQLFGAANSAGPHLVNLAWHIANTVALFYLLTILTGATWRSAIVAAFFAVHPLHVESVAWIAERKDVLSTFFGLLAIMAYVGYVRRKSPESHGAASASAQWRYVLVVVLLAASLLSKPMLVTLPFVLLLLDYWPLSRLDDPSNRWTTVRRLVVEKVPLFATVALSCVVTWFTQVQSGAIVPLDRVPFDQRLANAVLSYVAYLWKMFWPVKLAVLYPFPDSFNISVIILAGGVLVVITGLTIIGSRRGFSYLATGWLWYLGMLVPVIGLVQVGQQAMADRYSYLPIVGIFVLLVWGCGDLASHFRLTKPAGAICLMLILACAARTRDQVALWRNSETLLGFTLQTTERNAITRNNLGTYWIAKGEYQKAMEALLESLKISPDFSLAHNNLGIVLLQLGRNDEAFQEFASAVQSSARNALAYKNWADGLAKSGNLGLAIEMEQKALQIDPGLMVARRRMAQFLALDERASEAIDAFKWLLEFDGNKADYHNAIARCEYRLRHLPEAALEFGRVIALQSDFPLVHSALGRIRLEQRRVAEAVELLEKAIALNPQDDDAHKNLGQAYMMRNLPAKALAAFREAARLNEKDTVSANAAAWIMATSDDPALKNPAEAVRLAEAAVKAAKDERYGALDTLSVAYAAAGKFSEAIRTAEQAKDAAAKANDTGLAAEIDERLKLFRSGKPYLPGKK